MIPVLPRQSSEPCRGLRVLRNDVQNRPPRLAGLKAKTRLVEGSGLFEKGLALRRDRDDPIQMSQRAVKIPGCAGNAGRKKVRGGIAGASGKACFDMGAGRLDLTFGIEHGGKKVMEHGIAGLADQTLFAELARLLGLPGIEGSGGTTNNVLGAVLIHIKHLRTNERVGKEGSVARLNKKAGSASRPSTLLLSSSAKADDPVPRGFSILSLTLRLLDTRFSRV
jgi:hypothetical protein